MEGKSLPKSREEIKRGVVWWRRQSLVSSFFLKTCFSSCFRCSRRPMKGRKWVSRWRDWVVTFWRPSMRWASDGRSSGGAATTDSGGRVWSGRIRCSTRKSGVATTRPKVTADGRSYTPKSATQWNGSKVPVTTILCAEITVRCISNTHIDFYSDCNQWSLIEAES